MFFSIFDKIQDYTSNPIKEYIKIKKFVDESYSRNYIHLSDDFEAAFRYSPELSSMYASFSDCVEECTYSLEQWIEDMEEIRGESSVSYLENAYSFLQNEQKEELLNCFLLYVQVVKTVLNICLNILNQNYVFLDNKDRDLMVFNHLSSMIDTSLRSLNYKAINIKGNKVDIIKNDAVAECVAAKSPKNISDAILLYLGGKDMIEKENRLHTLIDLLEPTLNRYSEHNLVSKTKEYVQLIRHPEVKKDDKQYKWFFKNKKKYLDDIFALCLFSQQYAISKEIVNSFEKSKNDATK